ncbi:hypothetical protein [Methanosarcina sp. Kolksee]|uniref:hypothetical protein n=1 Tax=Methanosarcina sp. Kolksee TaxID=1434099 RepID=UPI001E5FD4B3|nr:hypothetical protein [Methanosarcina sp. Kolksee]
MYPLIFFVLLIASTGAWTFFTAVKQPQEIRFTAGTLLLTDENENPNAQWTW